MAFTDEDRNILIKTATKVENIEGWMANLPCQQHPPECTQEARVKLLETSQKRLANGFVTAIIITVVTAIGAYIKSLIP
jgi:hypothetical protein